MIEPTNLQATGVIQSASWADFHSIVLIVVAIFSALTTVIVSLMKMGVSKTLNELRDVWEAIKEIRTNQATLRAEIPRDYLRVSGPGYMALHEGIERIENAFDKFAMDCRDGKCGGKR